MGEGRVDRHIPSTACPRPGIARSGSTGSGYVPSLEDTGCHQIHGARFLAREGYPKRLVALVAHHSAATCEAEERGLLAQHRGSPSPAWTARHHPLLIKDLTAASDLRQAAAAYKHDRIELLTPVIHGASD
jgi:hypothetical protein